jgi:hypothetical protein
MNTEMTAPALQATEQHREHRAYTKSGVFRTKLSAPQIKLLEHAGHGGIIRAEGGVTWLSLRSMVDKGAADIISQDVRHLSNGKTIKGRINAVRVK